MNPYKYWTVALRKKDGEWFRPDKSKSGIQADPFLVSYNGKTYLFYEKADPITLKGYLVCMDIDKKRPKVILKESFHLSYPFVFMIGKEWYMIPESKQNHCIMLYKAKQFPWKWEPYRKLLDADAVDTTCLEREGTWYFYTYVNGTLHIYTALLDENGIPLHLKKICEQQPSKRKRPGGKFFYHDGKLLRPAQICEHFYGEALVFCTQNWTKENQVVEMEDTELHAGDISIKEKHLHPIGIHTYNRSEEYEVVDLYCEQRGIAALIKKTLYIPLQILYERDKKK